MANYHTGVQLYTSPADDNISLTQHFKVKEFKCKDGSQYIFINPDLVNTLERLFTYLGAKAINITCGYRTPTHNVKQGIKKTYKLAQEDNHALGCAVDFWVKKTNGTRFSQSEIVAGLKAIGHKGGIGIINSTTVHIDCGIRNQNPYIFKE